jgi:hypothetical protein
MIKLEWPKLGGRPYSHPLHSDFLGGAIDLTRNSYEIMIAAPQKPIQLSLHRSIFLKQNRRKITSRNDYTINFFIKFASGRELICFEGKRMLISLEWTMEILAIVCIPTLWN